MSCIRILARLGVILALYTLVAAAQDDSYNPLEAAERTLSLLNLRQVTNDLDLEQLEKQITHGSEGKDETDVANFIRKLLYPKIPTAFSSNVGDQCKKDSLDYLAGVLNYTDWALKMYDAAEVSSPGYFSGSLHSMGHFDQCLSTRNEYFQGKYCMAFYTLKLNSTASERSFQTDLKPSQRGLLTLVQLLGLNGTQLEENQLLPIQALPLLGSCPSVALCLPSSCSGEEVQKAFADLIGSYRVVINEKEYYTATYTGDEFCYVDTGSTANLDGADIAMICVLSVIGVLIVLSTAYEMIGEYMAGEPLLTSPTAREKKYVNYLCLFSLVNNTRKLMSARSAEGSLNCLHGIRVFSMTWVVMGHTWSCVNAGYNMNTASLYPRAHNWPLQTIFNASFSVDSFFVISGLLATYLLLKQLDKVKGRFNPLMLYLHRYLRLTPVYAVLLGFNATLAADMSAGPIWYGIVYYAEACRKVWWKHLLYINNLWDPPFDEQCMGETWYVAADMQLFLVMPFLVYPIWRWKAKGLIWLALWTAASFAGNLYYYITTNALPSSATRGDGDGTASLHLAFRPWFRAPSYFAGMFVGWALYETKKRDFKLNKIFVVLGWACATAIALAVLYGLTPYSTEDVFFPTALRATYGSFGRFSWSMALGWVIYACVNGYGGYVNEILSWSFFIPLGRLCYCVYLIHLNLLTVYPYDQKNLYYYTDLNTIYMYLGTLTMSLGIAYIAAVSVETPFLLLEKMLFAENATPKKPKQDELAKLEEIQLDAGNHNTAFEKTD